MTKRSDAQIVLDALSEIAAGPKPSVLQLRYGASPHDLICSHGDNAIRIAKKAVKAAERLAEKDGSTK